MPLLSVTYSCMFKHAWLTSQLSCQLKFSYQFENRQLIIHFKV